MPTFLTLAHSSHAEPAPVKKSRFLADAAPVSSSSEALNWVAEIQARYADARHHAFAWRLATGDNSRAHDAGEPRGSAGQPILNHIDGAKLRGVCVVVTRYFGGTKLGVGGLIRAYGGAAGEAIRAAEIIEVRELHTVQLKFNYGDQGTIESVLRGFSLALKNANYGAQVCGQVNVPVEEKSALIFALSEATSGRVNPT